jgi:hypothetical protein
MTSEVVEVRETHISWVFLAGERAYKLKKPLVLSFLDYGTPIRRRGMCDEEVRLNRRLAPDLYLGVRGVAPGPGGVELTGQDDPSAIDYVVEMRRYDEDRTLAATLDRGELSRTAVADVARTLAEFHRRGEPARDDPHGAHLVEREVDRNVEELLAVAPPRAERTRIRALAAFMTAFVASRSRELDERAARGMIRECHGDLRAEHVIIPAALEFGPSSRSSRRASTRTATIRLAAACSARTRSRRWRATCATWQRSSACRRRGTRGRLRSRGARSVRARDDGGAGRRGHSGVDRARPARDLARRRPHRALLDVVGSCDGDS